MLSPPCHLLSILCATCERALRKPTATERYGEVALFHLRRESPEVEKIGVLNVAGSMRDKFVPAGSSCGAELKAVQIDTA